MFPAAISATPRANQRTVIPWLALGIGVLSSFLLFAFIRDVVENSARLRFERQAGDANGVIQERIQFYADILYGLKALFAAQSPVSRVQFHDFVESLDLKNRYPGFDVVNYAMYVPGKEKNRFEEAVRRDKTLDPRGYAGFAIKPPGDRPEYYVIVYVEPMKGFEFSLGIDISANPAATTNRDGLTALMRAARDSGALIASGLPIRIKAAMQYTGLAMRLAVYRSGMRVDTVEQRRAAYLGSVGAGFNVENLMKGVLDEEMSRYVRFRLYDAGPAIDGAVASPSGARRLLFDSNQLNRVPSSQPAADDLDSIFTRVVPMEVGGRTWEVLFSARKDAVIDHLDRLLPTTVLAGGVLSSMLLFGVLYSLSHSRSQALKIAAQMTKDLRETSRRLVEVQEAERRLLAGELHDRVGQNLTALGLNLSIVANGLAPEDYPELVARLEDSSLLVQGTVDAMRDVMAELRPHALDDYGLPAALRSLATGFSRRTGIQVAFEADSPAADVPKTVDLAMFRIAQEALNNVAKHSKANRVDIEFRRVNGTALLSVADNGIGFDPRGIGASKPNGGWGLLIMRERAEAVGAQFSLKADPDAGVQVLVEYGVGTGA